MLIPISSLKKPSKNGASMSGAQNANPEKLLTKTVPTAPKCFQKQREIKILVSNHPNTSHVGAKMQHLQKKHTKIQKRSPFQQVPKSQNCYKKQYEVKIFVVHDQRRTKNQTHAPNGNHEKGLTKTTNKSKKTHIFEERLRLKIAVKNNTKSRFSFRMTKT